MFPVSHVTRQNFFFFLQTLLLFSHFFAFPFFPVLSLILLLSLRCFQIHLTLTISLGIYNLLRYLLRKHIIPVTKYVFFSGALFLLPLFFSLFPSSLIFLGSTNISPVTLTVPLGLNNLLRYPLRKDVKKTAGRKSRWSDEAVK